MKFNSFFSLLNHKFIKFLIVGGINTLLSFLVYQIFLLNFNYKIAYLGAYIFGVIFTLLLNARVVFYAKISSLIIFLYTTFFIISYLLGLFLIQFGVEAFLVDKRIIILFVSILLAPFNFFSIKYIMQKSVRLKN